MSPMLLAGARLGHQLGGPQGRSGLWVAMADRFRAEPSIPTVAVSELTPVRSLFDYDRAEAVELLELPAEISGD